MISGFPAESYKKFEAVLNRTPGDTGFERLKNYFELIETGTKDSYSWSFDNRLKDGKFFYYPYEGDMPARGMTCFEKSSHLMMAAMELYPESEPRMAYVDEGKRGIHSMVLFNHEGSLWGGDPNYSLFNPVFFNGKKIVSKDSDTKVKYRSLSFLTDKEVGNVVSGLRGTMGIERFLSEGGQRVLESPDSFRPYSVFMKCQDGKLISDLRFNDFDLFNNTAIRRNYDFGKDEFGIEFLAYKHEDWSNLKNVRKIGWSGNNCSIGGKGVHINQFATVDQMRNWGIDNFVKQFFSYHQGVKGISKNKHKLRDKVFYLSAPGREEVRSYVKKDIQDYIASLPESFGQHVLDYIYYKDSDGVVPALMGNENAKSWKDFKIRGRNIYAKEFVHTLYSTSHRETKKAVNLIGEAVTSMKVSNLFKNLDD